LEWTLEGGEQERNKIGIVHIESGKHSEDQHVTNLTAAPDPAHPEDYNDQYTAAVQRINPVDRPPTEYDLQAGDDIIVNAQGKETL
jgi:hypothetical protein